MRTGERSKRTLMSTTGEPTPIYANRDKGGLPGRSGSNEDDARGCIVSQAETADGIILRGEEEREYSA